MLADLVSDQEMQVKSSTFSTWLLRPNQSFILLSLRQITKKEKLLHPDPQYFKINTIISCTYEPPRDQDHMCCMWGVQSEAALTWKINTDNRSWHIDIIAGDLFWTEASFEWCKGENEHPLCCIWGEITLKWLLLWKSLAWNEVVSAGFHSVSGEIWGRGWTCSYLWWMLTF